MKPAGTMASARLSLQGDLAELERARPIVSAFLVEAGAGARTVYAVDLALEEIFTNIVKYAFADAAADHAIDVHLETAGDSIRLAFEDDGRPFDPTGCAPALPRGGMGLRLVRSMCAGLAYAREHGRNRLVLTIARG